MAKRVSIPLSLIVLIAVTLGALRALADEQPVEHHVVPLKILTKLPTAKRVEKVAGDPGRPVADTPEGCFLLKLGNHVRGGNGEGAVVGAQCTPGQLTQYRIEKADGELFWAQRDELTAL